MTLSLIRDIVPMAFDAMPYFLRFCLCWGEGHWQHQRGQHIISHITGKSRRIEFQLGTRQSNLGAVSS